MARGNDLTQHQIPGGPRTLPVPRALKDARDVRRELVALYKQTKRLQVDSQIAGRLTYILNSLVTLDANALMDQRVAAIETRLGSTVRSNGHDTHAEARS
jgi:hypothetical protein